MQCAKSYIIGMVIGELARIQSRPYQAYEPHDSEEYDFHRVEATANMDCVPVESLKSDALVRTHELAMAMVFKLRNTFTGHNELLLYGTLPYFDLDISPDILKCSLTILTRKQVNIGE